MKTNRFPSAMLAVFLTAECIIYAVFLVLDLTGNGSAAIWLKDLGIVLCLSCSLYAAFHGSDRLVTLAMGLTVAADCFLLVAGEHLFVGVLLFLCVQTVYFVRLRLLGAPQAATLRAGLALLAGLLLYLLKMATPLTLLSGLYFSQLLSNAVLAWTIHNRRFAIGLTLFVCCDICVGLSNCGVLTPATSFGMWLFYLPSQVLIVLSALPKEASHENQ